MSFTSYGGVRELFRLVRKANPSLPVELTEENCYVPVRGGSGELASAKLAGKYRSGVRGYRDVSYQRLDLGKLFKNTIPQIGITEEKPLFELLADIYYATGFAFDQTDLEPVGTGSFDGFPWKVRLKAASTSLVYFGEAEVEFIARKQRMAEAVLQKDLEPAIEGVVYDGVRDRAELITFGIDYTSRATVLTAFPLGSLAWSGVDNPVEALCAQLADTLNDIDRLPWKYVEGPNAWTLNGANVVYNGKVADYNPTWWGVDDIRRPNDRYDRVMVVVFEQDTTTPAGFYGSAMFIHYNTEIDNEVPDGTS